VNDILSLFAFGPDGWGDEILQGALVTIELAVATLPFGLAIGFAVALTKDARSRWVRIIGDAYTTVFRGLPELLTLFIVYYGGQILLNKAAAALFGDGAGVQVSSFISGMIALSLVLGAFSSEVFIAAMRSVPRGQPEAAYALGLSSLQTLRLVTGPQLWRIALPGLTNNWLVLLKDTSLVSVIALNDLMRETFVAAGVTKQPFFFYLAACILYLIMSGISSAGALWLEARANRGFAGARH
jgi:polar amino acid transport system permease protein